MGRIVLSRKAKILLGLAVLALAVAVGWQIASCEIANLELQADMRDIAAQVASRIGLEAPTPMRIYATLSSTKPRNTTFSLSQRK